MYCLQQQIQFNVKMFGSKSRRWEEDPLQYHYFALFVLLICLFYAGICQTTTSVIHLYSHIHYWHAKIMKDCSVGLFSRSLHMVTINVCSLVSQVVVGWSEGAG